MYNSDHVGALQDAGIPLRQTINEVITIAFRLRWLHLPNMRLTWSRLPAILCPRPLRRIRRA